MSWTKSIQKAKHLQTAAAVVAVIALLSVLFGTSLNPFLQSWGPTSNPFTVNALWGLVIGAIVATVVSVLLYAFYHRKLRIKFDWGHILISFFAYLILPLVIVAIAWAFAYVGISVVSTFLLGWGFAYLLLFLWAYIVSKLWAD